jgi:hypothetical protein
MIIFLNWGQYSLTTNPCIELFLAPSTKGFGEWKTISNENICHWKCHQGDRRGWQLFPSNLVFLTLVPSICSFPWLLLGLLSIKLKQHYAFKLSHSSVNTRGSRMWFTNFLRPCFSHHVQGNGNFLNSWQWILYPLSTSPIQLLNLTTNVM